MKTIRRYMFFVLLLLAAVACRLGAGAERGAAGLDYGRADMWYRGGTAASAENADVFYIAPTCNWGRTDADGTVHWQMDVYDTVQRANLQAPLRLAERVFAEGNRFYAPYYRQITMESWFEPDSVIGARFAVAMEDVREAFRYYLEHFNGGRPFVLAGHSQGARCVLELLKEEMNDSLYGRLVAAYVVGYRITDGELEGARYVVPAADSLDTGVVICINSVADTSALSPLFRGNRACINPMNWRTDFPQSGRDGRPAGGTRDGTYRYGLLYARRGRSCSGGAFHSGHSPRSTAGKLPCAGTEHLFRQPAAQCGAKGAGVL